MQVLRRIHVPAAQLPGKLPPVGPGRAAEPTWMLWRDVKYSFVGAFAKLRKATISFGMSVCPSVRMEQLGFYWTDFHKIWHLSIFRKSVEKSHISVKSDKNNGTLHEDQCTFMIISIWILLRRRNFSDKRFTENQNTHFVFSNFFSRKSCQLWDNVEKIW